MKRRAVPSNDPGRPPVGPAVVGPAPAPEVQVSPEILTHMGRLVGAFESIAASFPPAKRPDHVRVTDTVVAELDKLGVTMTHPNGQITPLPRYQADQIGQAVVALLEQPATAADPWPFKPGDPVLDVEGAEEEWLRAAPVGTVLTNDQGHRIEAVLTGIGLEWMPITGVRSSPYRIASAGPWTVESMPKGQGGEGA